MAAAVNAEEIERKVIDTIVREMTLKRENVTRDSRLVEDLGAGSLHLIEIAFALEEEFSVELPPETEQSIKSVGDIARLVGEALARKG